MALSRARCLAILIANPRLLETACHTVKQMGLINTRAGIRAWAKTADVIRQLGLTLDFFR